MDKIKHTFSIFLEDIRMECYVVENGDKYLNANVRRALKPSFNIDSHITIADGEGKEIGVYSINEVTESIKPRTMRELARRGSIAVINEGLEKGTKKKEAEKTDFDKFIKRSLEFNPNE